MGSPARPGRRLLPAGWPAGAELLGDPLLEVRTDLVADVLLEAADDQALVAEVLRGVVVGIADGGGVEQAHQRGEAARRAIVRRGREQHQGVGAGGQQAGQASAPRQAVLACTGRDVVALVDDDDVPPGVLQIVAVLEVALERIDRDDAAVEVVERVVVAGMLLRTRCKTHRIQPHQRDGEAAPPLLLELGQHALERDDQDALPRPRWISSVARIAGFQRLAQTRRRRQSGCAGAAA